MNMSLLSQGTITDRTVAALSAESDTVVWDRALTGFGVRVYPSGARVYVVQARGPEGTKRITVGRHGVIGATEARRRAALIIARIRAGEAPVPEVQKPESVTVATLAERYLREHVAVRCKPTTATQYRLAIERYIVPALGTRPVSSLGRSQVAELQHSLSDRPAMANLVIATLSRMIEQGMAWGVAGEISNPCRSAPKYRARRRERFLTDAEFRRLGSTLDELEATGRLSPHAAAALRLLMLTGCRRNEILTLRWEDVHLHTQELRLRDSKTGPRTVSLSPEAAQVLASIERLPGNPWVIPGARPGARLSSLFEPWRKVRARAGLDDVRIHDLRHSYASRALALGESLPVIAKLLGHAQIQTTARYTHLTRDAVKDAATRVAEGIAEDILIGHAPNRGPDLRGPNGAPRIGVGCNARGAPAVHGSMVKERMRASAARVAAEIGEDILPPWQRGKDLSPTRSEPAPTAHAA
ncbi:MAG: tyrosine-type recombinase/integrase [Rhodospirillales bacterium]|nr:tyrosine-type recombinase/integrase [Rhodospirillales bacterium]